MTMFKQHNAPDFVAIILALIMLIALLGHIAHWLIYPDYDKSEIHIEYWGRIYLIVVGGLLLFIGQRGRNKD